MVLPDLPLWPSGGDFVVGDGESNTWLLMPGNERGNWAGMRIAADFLERDLGIVWIVSWKPPFHSAGVLEVDKELI